MTHLHFYSFYLVEMESSFHLYFCVVSTAQDLGKKKIRLIVSKSREDFRSCSAWGQMSNLGEGCVPGRGLRYRK